jgi:hypothetical protein
MNTEKSTKATVAAIAGALVCRIAINDRFGGGS